ncbi:MAG: hypothetical protein PHS49_04785 [Candidatus Gracilibacteria bacterium]|nr:hypothetical protein [Candidatus Gracilibacteria bacterium]
MQQSNNKNAEPKFENPIFEQILKIINSSISAGEIQALEKKLGFKKTILKIIEKDKSNKNLALFLISEISPKYFMQFTELQSDISIAKVAIYRDSSLYIYASPILRKKTEFGFLVLESMVREGRSFSEIESYIEQNHKKNKNAFYEKYMQLLELGNIVYSNDITKQLIAIKESNNTLYEHIFKVGLVNKNTKKLEINNQFIKSIVTELTKIPEYQNLDIDKQGEFRIKYIENIFGIKISKLEENEKYIFTTLLNLIIINEAKVKLSKKDDIEEKDKNTQNENTQNNHETEKTINVKDDFEDLLEYTYPHSTFYVSDGGYTIETNIGNNLFITNNEKDKFTSKALANYIKFYNTMYKLGLIFLWQKYKNDFTILCNNKFGFDYMRNEGITESKTLSVLNLIGKNIGIPETTYLVDNYDSNGVLQETKKQEKIIGCFKTIGDAKLKFIEIKETGIINGDRYSDNSAFGNQAVENKLIEILCIDQKGNGLNISKWK